MIASIYSTSRWVVTLMNYTTLEAWDPKLQACMVPVLAPPVMQLERRTDEAVVGRESPIHYHLIERVSRAFTNLTAHSFFILSLESEIVNLQEPTHPHLNGFWQRIVCGEQAWPLICTGLTVSSAWALHSTGVAYRVCCYRRLFASNFEIVESTKDEVKMWQGWFGICWFEFVLIVW